jgi:serine/threonine protein phosphatase PrpC
MVTQSLGGSFGFKDIWPALGREPLLAGDVVLVCSDGLTDAVPHAAIVDIFRSSSTAQDCTEQLVHGALTHGAPDNLSVVTVMW